MCSRLGAVFAGCTGQGPQPSASRVSAASAANKAQRAHRGLLRDLSLLFFSCGCRCKHETNSGPAARPRATRSETRVASVRRAPAACSRRVMTVRRRKGGLHSVSRVMTSCLVSAGQGWRGHQVVLELAESQQLPGNPALCACRSQAEEAATHHQGLTKNRELVSLQPCQPCSQWRFLTPMQGTRPRSAGFAPSDSGVHSAMRDFSLDMVCPTGCTCSGGVVPVRGVFF